MADSVEKSKESTVVSRVKRLLKDITELIHNASEQDKQTVFSLLGNWEYTRRREQARKPCSFAIDYSTTDRVFKDFAQNISTGGVFIETHVPFSVGQEITLTFSSSDYTRPLKIAGEIAWTGPRGAGVKFKTPTKELEALVESL
jgi:Tfp pilus assembly protein PilZ